ILRLNRRQATKVTGSVTHLARVVVHPPTSLPRRLLRIPQQALEDRLARLLQPLRRVLLELLPELDDRLREPWILRDDAPTQAPHHPTSQTIQPRHGLRDRFRNPDRALLSVL